jgi:hypothetical protein
MTFKEYYTSTTVNEDWKKALGGIAAGALAMSPMLKTDTAAKADVLPSAHSDKYTFVKKSREYLSNLMSKYEREKSNLPQGAQNTINSLKASVESRLNTVEKGDIEAAALAQGDVLKTLKIIAQRIS